MQKLFTDSLCDFLTLAPYYCQQLTLLTDKWIMALISQDVSLPLNYTLGSLVRSKRRGANLSGI